MFRKSLIMSCAFLCGESKIIWLRTKNRLAENDFSFGAEWFSVWRRRGNPLNVGQGGAKEERQKDDKRIRRTLRYALPVVCLKEVFNRSCLCFGRSFCSFLCGSISRSFCFSLCFCSSLGSFLLCYFLSDLFIDFLLSLQTCFSGSLLLGGFLGLECF